MTERSSSRDRSLWQRYRGAASTAALALVAVVIVEVAFPGADLSRGSSDRYWFLGAVVLVTLVGFGVRRLLRGRRGSSRPDDEGRTSDPRREVGRGTNRRNVFSLALIGVVALGFAGWSLITDRGAESVAVGGGLGVASLAIAVVLHTWLLRRDEI